jgi:hypothetical protein
MYKINQFFYLCTLSSTQFVLVQVYHVYFPYDMFRPDGAIFSYVLVVVHSPSFCYSPLQWPVFTHWECVVYVLFVCPFFQVYCFWEVYIVKPLNFCITPRVNCLKMCRSNFLSVRHTSEIKGKKPSWLSNPIHDRRLLLNL